MKTNRQLENILLFGDGQTPGEVVVSPHDLPRIHVMVLQAFVARPEYFASSVEVRNKFDEHLMEHKAQMGEFPDALPYPEDASEAMLEPPQMGGGQPIQ